MIRKAIISVLLLIGVVASLNDDEIVNLPGISGQLNFKQYAGYVQVAPTRKLFYWFVESQRNPATDDVVLWLNGGPGCSSIGGGLMTENGPFRVNPDGKTIAINPNSWNNIANVLYLESPAGVGFSYSTNPSVDYTVGDKRTADDSYDFLQGFFQKYPQFKNNKFWVSGESYGGHYVPELANRILEGNKDPSNPKINLQGFLVGNAWTYMPIDNFGAVFFWWTHALISDQTFEGIKASCNFTNIGPLVKKSVDPATCNNFLNTANTEMGNINIYDIYVDVCVSSQARKIVEQFARAGSELHKAMLKDINPPYEPCADTYTSEYLNQPSVQKAIHAEISTPWYECSPYVHYNYSDVEASVIPLYEKFESTPLKILVYSGDVDAIVPYSGTRQWIADLKRPIVEAWRPWTVNKQVGGKVVVYKGFTFATVRNAGHMVPQTQPERAFAMFERFINGQPL